ncbi:DsbA family protein [Dongia deserti]|uniref:DsbA family protein n=1 Tax=Dongia deserti TaxID=2268030 RepID=UPI000E64ED67|nr:DsbA family protein [Dongia deserti]
MNKGVLVGLIVLVLVAVGVGGWFYYSSKSIGAGSAVPGDVSEKAPAVPTVTPEDKFLGNADAPVTIVEYFSLGCPHCKNFHENILPKLKADYIDTGKVRLVFRDFPLDGVSYGAALLTRCVNDLAYFPMVDTLFQEQDKWHVQGGIEQIRTIAKSAGIDDSTFQACLDDPARKEKIKATQDDAVNTLKVDSTPTFFIDDRVLKGVGDYAPFKAAIENALAAKQ